MGFGKLLGFDVDENQVSVKYENQEVIVQVITEEIIRLFVPCWMKDYTSVAVEGQPSVPCDFDVTEEDGELLIKTSAVVLHLKDNFEFVYTDKYGDEILSSYEGKRKL
jgi:alpha-glucosidase